MTKISAPDMPSAVDSFLETPRNGQIPRILANTMLFTRMAPMVIANHSFKVIKPLLLWNDTLLCRHENIFGSWKTHMSDNLNRFPVKIKRI